MMDQADELMAVGVERGVFPGGVLLVAAEGVTLFCKAYGWADIFSKIPMRRGTIFDLASLTKPLATTLAVMRLIERKELSLEQRVASILPGFGDKERKEITIRNLLCHNSGLPDYREYYKELRRLPESSRSAALKAYLVKEPLLYPAGKKTVYSDLGFMVLGWVVENVSGKRLDRFTAEEIYEPLRLGCGSADSLFFVELCVEGYEKESFAATEVCPWRKVLLKGAVHDDNAYVLGGVSGHAGLFGGVRAVYKLLSFLLGVFQGGLAGPSLFSRGLVRTFFTRDDNAGRALGFDTPSVEDSSSGRFFSRQSIGHLGFTGVSFWMDPERSMIVILLTNRVHPSRNNDKLKSFRPVLHDAVMKNF